MSSHCIVLNTCPDGEVAEKIAQHLVSQQLAACVNIIPGITSIYQWQGELQRDQELLLVVKTRNEVLPQVQQAIIEQHPYELPEVISVPINQGLTQYLNWIDQNTQKKN